MRRYRFSLSCLLVKFNRSLAEKYKVRRRYGNRPVDAEDCDLEFVTRLDRIGQYDPIGDVETLDRGRAGDTGTPRHFSITPDFCVIVDIGGQHCFGTRRFKVPDFCRYDQVGAEPEKGHLAAATSVGETLGLYRWPR